MAWILKFDPLLQPAHSASQTRPLKRRPRPRPHHRPLSLPIRTWIVSHLSRAHAYELYHASRCAILLISVGRLTCWPAPSTPAPSFFFPPGRCNSAPHVLPMPPSTCICSFLHANRALASYCRMIDTCHCRHWSDIRLSIFFLWLVLLVRLSLRPPALLVIRSFSGVCRVLPPTQTLRHTPPLPLDRIRLLMACLGARTRRPKMETRCVPRVALESGLLTARHWL